MTERPADISEHLLSITDEVIVAMRKQLAENSTANILIERTSAFALIKVYESLRWDR